LAAADPMSAAATSSQEKQMPLYSRHELTLRPEYRIIVVRDIDADAAEGRSQAMDEASSSVAASTGYEVVILAAQDFTPVRLEVETWDVEPDPLQDQGWAGPLTFSIDSSTGQLLAGDTFGNAVDGIDPPAGPGVYTVTVHYRGRDEAMNVVSEILAARAARDNTAADNLSERASGTERYLIRIFPEIVGSGSHR
jgi:hypothetical protein